MSWSRRRFIGAERQPKADDSSRELQFFSTLWPGIHVEEANLTNVIVQLRKVLGRASEAMVRLAGRLTRRGEDPETLAGLVQVLRWCGLLEDSIATHQRAIALDPTVKTSVAHTYFLRGEFSRVFETYNSGAGYYLDAAAWAGLGAVDRAVDLLRTRLSQFQPGPSMSSLMASLLAVLETGKRTSSHAWRVRTSSASPKGSYILRAIVAC